MKQVSQLRRDLPPLIGRKITVEVQPQLSARRGRLFSRVAYGTAVYAGSFIRRRSIVLESELLRTPRLLRAIFVHELAHFVWARLGNSARQHFFILLQEEYSGQTRGELGESAAVHKAALSPDAVLKNTRQWRDYVCESFCDTAADLYLPGAFSPSPRLSQCFVQRRYDWFTLHRPDQWPV